MTYCEGMVKYYEITSENSQVASVHIWSGTVCRASSVDRLVSQFCNKKEKSTLSGKLKLLNKLLQNTRLTVKYICLQQVQIKFQKLKIKWMWKLQ